MSTPDNETPELIDDGAIIPSRRDARDLVPSMVTSIDATKARLEQLQQFVRSVMVEGTDYGIIPGTPKPTLLRPGAEKLIEVYGYAPSTTVVHRVEDWDRGFIHYEVRCDLTSKRTGNVVASAIGACNSYESRYRWRTAQRVCPTCGQPAIIEGRAEYGGGHLCFKKKGGCGAKYAATDKRIVEQPLGRVQNPDIADIAHVILSMAAKRAIVAVARMATRSSDLFTDSIEDLPAPQHEPPPEPAAPPARRVTTPASRHAPPEPESEPESEPIAAHQRHLLAHTARSAGHSADSVRAWLHAVLGVTNSAEIESRAYQYVLNRLADPAPLSGDLDDLDASRAE